MSPKLTEEVPVKFLPLMVIDVPVVPSVGLKEAIDGSRFLKLNPGKVAEPLAVVTLTLPLAPLPTIALILEALVTTNDAAGVSPKLTEEVPVKLVPLMVIDVPVVPSVGLKVVMVGITTVSGATSVLLHCNNTASTKNKYINFFIINKVFSFIT